MKPPEGDRVAKGPQGSSLKRRPAAALLVLLLGLGSACTPAVPKDATALSGEEVEQLISGNTFAGGFNAQRLIMVFYENGKLRGSLGLSGSDSGTWQMQGELYCQHWTRYFGATKGCYAWYPRGDGFVLRSADGYRTPDIIGKVEPGKPKGY